MCDALRDRRPTNGRSDVTAGRPTAASVNCQLYLLTPPAIEPASFATDLAAALDTGDVASVLLLPESVGGDVGALRRAVDTLRPVAQQRDVAFLIDGHPALAAETGCDGVHTCPDGPPYKVARLAVGPQAIVGYSARFSRHTAMVAAEQGADYVVFGRRHPSPEEVAETMDLVGWWEALMEVPCVCLLYTSPSPRDQRPNRV